MTVVPSASQLGFIDPLVRAPDIAFMRHAMHLARRAFGETSPNPLVGAVLVKGGKIIGRGWHRRAGEPHAEIEALRAAAQRGRSPHGAALFVTLEPCCTHGRTPPCTDAIIAARIRRVVVAATDPNPNHAGRGFARLRKAGIEVEHGLLAAEAEKMNEAFNHWIVHRTPFVTVKAAMTLDGKIATAAGESKWITGEVARAHAMTLRHGADAILVGVNTVLLDDPGLTFRPTHRVPLAGSNASASKCDRLRRIVLDSHAHTPLESAVVCDEHAALTTVVVTPDAPARRVARLSARVQVWRAPTRDGRPDLEWLLHRLGAENVTSLLVEGGGEVNATFLERRLAHRVAFFYAPKILGGRDARRGVAGRGASSWAEALELREIEWRRFGVDLFMTGRVGEITPRP